MPKLNRPPTLKLAKRPEVRVRLTWAEVLIAAQVGCMRNVQSLREGFNPYDVNQEDNWAFNIEGACGEIAVAKHLNVFWSGALGNVRADDAGPFQVRTNASRRLDDMAMRDRDRKHLDKVFISVLSFLPEFVLCGWLYGRDCFRDEWKRGGTPGRDPLYWVPRKALRPIDTLPPLDTVSPFMTKDDERVLAGAFDGRA